MSSNRQDLVPRASVHAVPKDIERESLNFLIVTSFPLSRSHAYPRAVAAAKTADVYDERELDGKPLHIAGFGKSPEQLTRAIAFHAETYTLKNVLHYVSGRRLIDGIRVEQILSCYSEALRCADHRAHCSTVEGRSLFEDEKREFEALADVGQPVPLKSYLFPCSYLLNYRPRLNKKKHPSSVVDQIQAAGVKHGCDWCPLFDATQFKEIV